MESQNCNARKRQNLFFLFSFSRHTNMSQVVEFIPHKENFLPQMILECRVKHVNILLRNCLTIAACEHFNFFLTKHNDNLHVLQYCMKIPGSSLSCSSITFLLDKTHPPKTFFSFSATLICSFLRTANIF